MKISDPRFEIDFWQEVGITEFTVLYMTYKPKRARGDFGHSIRIHQDTSGYVRIRQDTRILTKTSKINQDTVRIRSGYVLIDPPPNLIDLGVSQSFQQVAT